MLLPELVVSIVLLLSKNAGLIQEAGAIPLLAGLLEHLDRFNHLAPGKDRDDSEDLAWPGIMGMFFNVWDQRFSLLSIGSFLFIELIELFNRISLLVFIKPASLRI